MRGIRLVMNLGALAHLIEVLVISQQCRAYGCTPEQTL
jgi:hypothetical protein